MSILSFEFIILFFFILLLYWRLAQKYQWLLLLCVSIYMYVSWKPAYAVFLLLTILTVYAAALLLVAWRKHKKLVLGLALTIIFSSLALFKYYGFFSLTLVAALAAVDITLSLPTFRLLVPLGLSFFTFQAASYLIDVYRGKITPEKNLGLLALFVSFFPLVSAGPIERAGHMLPQFRRKQRFDYQNVVSGLQLLTLGLFKKLVVADNLGLVVDAVFSSLTEFKGFSLIVVIFLFSLQIYYDFSGYTDIARGIARILGFRVLQNFRTPYFSSSIAEFWQRWHMTLSNWFKDYLYIPLGGNRKGLWRTCLNTLIVFAICGLWHGPSWTFVIWGLLHGAYLSVQRILQYFGRARVQLPKLLSVILTYILVCIAWVFFRSETLSDALYIFRYALVGITNIVHPSYIWSSLSQIFDTNQVEMMVVAFCIAAFVAIEAIASKENPYVWFSKLPIMVRWLLYGLTIISIILLRDVQVREFIYVQF